MGKYLLLSIALIFLIGKQLMAQPYNTEDTRLEERLGALRGKNRVLVLYAPTAEHPEYVKQLRMLADAKGGLTERDLVQITRTDEKMDAGTRDYLRRELNVPAGTFNVLLIGKDGGVKYRSTKATDPEQLFETIDAMPMRQSEMREGKKQE
jgi:hypothetical protein